MVEEKKDTDNNSLDIRKEALGMVGINIRTMLDTIDKIDAKVGILIGFYFLIFIQVISILKDYWIGFLLLYLLFSILSSYFLLKNFWLKNIKYLYPNLDEYCEEEKSEEVYYRDISGQYKKIKESLKEAIIVRRDDLKNSIVFLCASLIIFAIALLIPCTTHSFILIK